MKCQHLMIFLPVSSQAGSISLLLLDVRYANIQNLLIFDRIKVCQTAIKAYTHTPNNNDGTTIEQFPLLRVYPSLPPIFPNFLPGRPLECEIFDKLLEIELLTLGRCRSKSFPLSIFDGEKLHRLTASWLPWGCLELIKITLRRERQLCSSGFRLPTGMHSSCCLLILFTHNSVINGMPAQLG